MDAIVWEIEQRAICTDIMNKFTRAEILSHKEETFDMNKLETILYAGEDGIKAMSMYNLLVMHRDHRVPIRISDCIQKICKDNVYVSDVIKTFRDGKHIVSVKYDHNNIFYTTW